MCKQRLNISNASNTFKEITEQLVKPVDFVVYH